MWESLTSGLGLALAFVVVFVISTFSLGIHRGLDREKRLGRYFESLEEFQVTQRFHGQRGTGIAIDENSEKICLYYEDGRFFNTRALISASDLVSVELFEDGVSITKSEHSGGGGALVGGLLFGPVGAIIGAAGGSSSSVTTSQVSSIALRLVLNNTTEPLHDVEFLSVTSTKNGYFYKPAMAQARHWYGILEIFIRRESKTAQANLAKPLIVPASIADELKKLVELRESGVLSTDEFDAQKVRLLSH